MKKIIGYKLTNAINQTGFVGNHIITWGKNVTHETDGSGDLCSKGWIHYYDDPLLAVIFNSIHANFDPANMWTCEILGEVKENRGVKFGTTKLMTIKRITIPEISLVQKVCFGILCSKNIYKNKYWNQWADNYLSGKDRTPNAAYAAAYATDAAYAAAYAAYAAAYAAYAATDAAYATDAAAYAAAYATAYATDAATLIKTIDLKTIAKKAMGYR